ncbi:MAG TPA: response regulator [Steroidobacteraceae bacterium]|nr:response regulator [Steroidobacteraceae bacterium]
MVSSSGQQNLHSTEVRAGREVSNPVHMHREATLEKLLEAIIEERDQARQALEAALDERDRAHLTLRDAERRKDEFLATLAHELRNPLAPIRSAVQIMRMAEGDQATTSAARAIIERQLKHLVRLIDDLMDVSRLTRGKLELRKERVDLATVLQIAVEINRPLLESKQQHVTVELPPGPLLVEADTTRLAQVFANLLNNGAKYSDAWTDIAIRAAREGSQAVVRVYDRGIGVQGDMLERIFDMFTQVERPHPSPHDGLGVGLTLVKRLVELHGGTVSAYSDGPGSGSCFTVRLNLLPSLDEEAHPVAPTSASLEGPPRARILVADDNYDAAQSLALMLGIDGHEVRTASDGLEALRVAEEFRPQLVLLDIGMPKLDGYETARRLRERPWSRATRLFALTGWGQEEDRERARQAGFDRHLVKPVDPDELTELLNQTLCDAYA